MDWLQDTKTIILGIITGLVVTLLFVPTLAKWVKAIIAGMLIECFNLYFILAVEIADAVRAVITSLAILGPMTYLTVELARHRNRATGLAKTMEKRSERDPEIAPLSKAEPSGERGSDIPRYIGRTLDVENRTDIDFMKSIARKEILELFSPVDWCFFTSMMETLKDFKGKVRILDKHLPRWLYGGGIYRSLLEAFQAGVDPDFDELVRCLRNLPASQQYSHPNDDVNCLNKHAKEIVKFFWSTAKKHLRDNYGCLFESEGDSKKP